MAGAALIVGFAGGILVVLEEGNIMDTILYGIGLVSSQLPPMLAADAMYVPLDEELGIHPQDDNFLEKQLWDFKNTPRKNYPLLLHYHPLVIYRHRVIKQADVVMALFLLGKDFTHDEKRREVDYSGAGAADARVQPIRVRDVG